MDWDQPPPDFRYILFERVNPERDEARYYYLAWQQTLIHANAVVRMYGRKGETQRLISPQPFDSLEEAWPLIRSVIKTRLRHGYRVVQPEGYREESDSPKGDDTDTFTGTGSENLLPARPGTGDR